MINRIKALIIKELLAVWQDKKSRFVLVAAPLIQLFIFAFAATLDVTNVSIAILNRDTGKLSYELVQRFKGSPYFKEVKYITNIDEIRENIDMQKSMVVLHIDDIFSKNLLEGKSSDVQLVLDGRKSNTAQIVQGYAIQIIDQYNHDLQQKRNLPTTSTVVIPRNWFNPNLIYTWFNVPGLVAILTMFTSLLVTALSVAREREMGTFDQLLVSPLNPREILVGKTVPGIIIGMIEASVILVAAIFVFRIPFHGSLLVLYFAMFVFVLSVVGIGLFLSALCQTQQQALLVVYVFMTASITLSGFATPVDNMPIWLQKCTVANPIKYFLIIVRGVFLKGMPFGVVLKNLVPIVINTMIVLPLAGNFFKKRLG